MLLLVSGSTKIVRTWAAGCPNLGILIEPQRPRKPFGGLPWASDNGCFNGLDEPAFRRMLNIIRGVPDCLFVVAPDVVADARATTALYDAWEPVLRKQGFPVAYVLQDGLEPGMIPWERCNAVFVGGTTEFKLGPVSRRMVCEAKERGVHAHMGRVNTLRRLRYAHAIGCDSVDGTGFSKWVRHARRVKFWLEEIHRPRPLYCKE